MPSPITYTTTGSALSSDEIAFAQRVAASFSPGMGAGWIKTIRQVDPNTNAVVEYHAGKNIAYVTPGGATDYVSMTMPNPVPYRGVSIGVVDRGAPTVTSAHGAMERTGDTYTKTSTATLRDNSGVVKNMVSGSTTEVWTYGPGAGDSSCTKTFSNFANDYGSALITTLAGGGQIQMYLSGWPPTGADTAEGDLISGSASYSQTDFVGAWSGSISFGSIGYAAELAAEQAADTGGRKTYVMASDGEVLAETSANPDSSGHILTPYFVSLWPGSNWVKLVSDVELTPYGYPGEYSTLDTGTVETFAIPDDAIYPTPTKYLGYPVDFDYTVYAVEVRVPGSPGWYINNHSILVVPAGTIVGPHTFPEGYQNIIHNYNGYDVRMSDASLTPYIFGGVATTEKYVDAFISFNNRHPAWFKKNSDDTIAALKLGTIPESWKYQIKRDVDARYDGYPRDTYNILVGRHTRREILYSETAFSDTVTSDTSANLTQAGVKATTREVTLAYDIEVDGAVVTREEVFVGTLTQTVVEHAPDSVLSRTDVYDNWCNREATSLPTGSLSAMDAPYLKDRTTSRLGAFLNGTIQTGYNADSTLGVPGNPLTYVAYVPPYPAASSTLTATAPDFIKTWHADAKITYAKDGSAASNILNDSAMYGVTEVHISPVGLIADGAGHAAAGEAVGMFPVDEDGTQVEVYGTAVYTFDWQNGSFVFKSWKPLLDDDGNEITSKVVDLPAVWSDNPTNCIVTYKGLHWPDVIGAVKARDSDAKAGTFTIADPNWWAIVQAIK